MTFIRTRSDSDFQLTHRQTLPPIITNGLCVLMLCLALFGLVQSYTGHRFLSPTVALDIWIVTTSVVLLIRGRILTTPLLLFLGVYGLTRVIGISITGSPVADSLQAYRWLFYIVVFALALGKRWDSVPVLIKSTWILILLAVVNASITFITQGPGERPGLLLENNFELALFVGLVIALYEHLGRNRGWLVVLLGVLTILAGSRSGAIVYIILVFVAVLQAHRLNLFLRYMLALAGLVMTLIPVLIFTSRSQGIARIDRLRFLDVFIAETQNWTLLHWIFGTAPITPLSSGGCHALSYYESLFSSTDDGTCYSVILHSFLMRVIFDAGLLGLLISIAVPLLLMIRAGSTPLIAISLIAVSLANGVSVSGLNNPYVALPILIAILTGTYSRAMDDKDLNHPPTRQANKLYVQARRSLRIR